MNWEKGEGWGGGGVCPVFCVTVMWCGVVYINILLVEKTRTESQRSRSVSYTAVAQKKSVAVD